MDHKKPPVVVGGTCSVSIPSTRTITGTINYRYPPDFPRESQGRVKLVENAAKRVFNESAPTVQWERRLRDMRITCAMGPTTAFAQEAIRLGWDARRIDGHVRDFALGAAGWARLKTDSTRDIRDEIEASLEWREYEELLVERCDAVMHPPAGGGSRSADLLLRIVAKRNITIERWAADHKLGRTTVFDWKASQLAGKSAQGKVSAEKSAAIENAIEKDAEALGLATRTSSESSE
ncbi:MAG: hypothetical protein ABI759_01505 [Candidatus Solibacter sp.]